MSGRPETHVESFAELMARLNDPFADRAAVLRAADLDEAALRRLMERWSADLRGDPDGRDELARRFGDEYVRAAEEIAAARRGPRTPVADQRFLNADAQAWREEAAAVAARTPAEEPPAPAGTTAAAGPPAWVPEGMRHFADIGSTQPAATVVPRPALPFDPKAPSLLAKPGVPADAGSAVPRGMRHFSDIGSTQPAATVVPRPALPFDPPGGSAAPKAALPAPSAAAWSAPSTPALSRAPGILSLEQYASFCVELELDPSGAARLHERYRITAAQQQEFESHWRSRMDADPTVRMAWERACAVYRAWLAGIVGTMP